MDFMALFLELVDTIIVLVTKPFSLIKLSCIFFVKSTSIVVNTWAELLSRAIYLHVHIFSKLVVWTVCFMSLPARLLTALQRERLLEMHLHDMQDELETTVWEKKQLKERLKKVTKERRMMKVMLAELEEEHDQAIFKIELLEGELKDLKHENNRLKEVQEKAASSSKDHLDPVCGLNTKDADKNEAHEISSWSSGNHGSGVTVKDLLHDVWENKSKVSGMHDFMNERLNSSQAVITCTSAIMSKSSDVDDILNQHRDVAFLRSLFSAILSLLVGIIIWEAEEPCMPLVVALFSVVGMSMKSVVEFFSTIKNKPASDAVALLNFNWFILGTLTYPTLPKAARLFAPLVLRLSDHTVKSLGFS